MGRVTFTADGRMMSVVCDGRTELPVGVAREYSSYCGNYTYDGRRLVTRVDAASDPSRIGSDQVRGVRFEGEHMVLIPPPRRAGESEEHREITWERIAAEQSSSVYVNVLSRGPVADQDLPGLNARQFALAEDRLSIPCAFYLHISKKEQKARLQARLADPTKRWKFAPEDLAERAHWNEYISAYEIVLARCSTQPAPWFIVPADRKWYRNAVVARIVRSTFEALDLTYPAEMPGLDNVQIE